MWPPRAASDNLYLTIMKNDLKSDSLLSASEKQVAGNATIQTHQTFRRWDIDWLICNMDCISCMTHIGPK